MVYVGEIMKEQNVLIARKFAHGFEGVNTNEHPGARRGVFFVG